MLRVACVQINSLLGEIEINKSKIISLLSKIKHEIDLIVLPELALTGYNFSSRDAIAPYLDKPGFTPSTEFGKYLSQQYKCFTVIGYPELNNTTIYNACKLINPLGDEVYNYRKTFLYDTDEVWGCSENPERGFKSIDVILDKNYYINKDDKTNYKSTRINFGICMDLNPYKFKSPFNAFEFSMACYHNDADLVVCPMAWLSPLSPLITDSPDNRAAQATVQDATHGDKYIVDECSNVQLVQLPQQQGLKLSPDTPDASTVNYHMLRFFPLLRHPQNYLPAVNKSVSVVACNRVGVESDVVYGGLSSIFTFIGGPKSEQIDFNNPLVKLYGALPQAREAILYRQIQI